MKKIIHEVHRRSLWQVLGIYLAGSWIALQVVETLTESMDLPGWVQPFALVLLIIGLPIVLATAFVQEGMSAKAHAPPEESSPRAGEIPPGPPATASGAAALFTWRNAIMGGIGALIVWGLVALAWVLRGGGQVVAVEDGLPGGASPLQARVAAIAARADSDLPVLAVLPFEDSGSEDEYAFFADGVHEDLLTNLSKVRSLIVLARPTVMPYRDSELSVQQIATELGATAVVSGSVRRAQGNVRITVELIDPATNASLWAERYDRSLDDIFAVQSEIALAVATALRTNLSTDEEARLAAVPTGDLSAFDLYTRARQAYAEYEAAANQRAIQLFKGAIERDPAYGLAWAGLADAYAQTVSRWGAAVEWADSAVAAGSRAVELVPESSEAHKALGLALGELGRDAEAIASYERALELNPSNADAANNLAIEYGQAGRPSEAIPLYRLSERLRPHVFARTNMGSLFALMELPEAARDMAARDVEYAGESESNLNVLALVAWTEGDYSTVLELDQRAIDLDPTDPRSKARAALRALAAGELDLAERYARAALESESEGVFFHKNANTTLGQVALARGDTTAARRFLRASLAQNQDFEDRGAEDMWVPYQIGVIHAALGEDDLAIASALAAEKAGAIYPLLWDREPAFDRLREDPRFRELRAEAQRRFDAERARIISLEGWSAPQGR